jgi:hypothetical protein
MRAGFNPARRNRNIGTAKQGQGRNNRLVVPDICLRGRRWAEQLNPHQKIQRLVSGREVVFLVEEAHAACIHACTVEDIRQVLANIPLPDWEGLDTFVLRQSTHKQGLLRPAWGRMFYSADLGLPGRKTLRLGPAIILEAVDCSAKLKWRSALDPDDQAELARLQNDGHRVVREGNHYVSSMTPNSVRATQLYRTLLHEIGHWVDYLEKVERPAEKGIGSHAELSTAYFRRPKQEREAFAHRYAEATRERLKKFGVFPFDSITNLKPGVW